MDEGFYTSAAWLAARERVLARDRHRCSVARLLGGRCRGRLHVHHIEPRDERPDLELDEGNLATACAAHHARWEGLRRQLARVRRPERCPHRHVTLEGRLLCEAQRARRRGLVVA